MNTEQLKQLGKEIHENSAAKGFWHEKENRSKGEMVMLIISELGECLEAHRKGRICSAGEKAIPPLIKHYIDAATDSDYTTLFNGYVKDTVEDELADVLIRILDYVHGWGLPLIERDYREETTGNFGHDLLRINHYILFAFHDDQSKDWGYVVASIFAFCRWSEINIQQHVKWKMRFNSTRPMMHNKAY